MLEGQLGAEGGPFAIGYVIAHEYGHHVEDQLGVLGKIRTQKGPKSDAVRVELMADCLAGVWAKGAQETRDQDGRGDHRGADPGRHQARHRRRPGSGRRPDPEAVRSGRVDTDSFTHGSAEQRVRWFNKGMSEGTIKGCDTFATDNL